MSQMTPGCQMPMLVHPTAKESLVQRLHVKVTLVSETEMCTVRMLDDARVGSACSRHVGALYVNVPQSYDKDNLRSTSSLLMASILSTSSPKILINNYKHMHVLLSNRMHVSSVIKSQRNSSKMS